MFHHVKELQFNARVSKPDPKFATLLLEQFGGANGELKAAMQYFVQAFSCRQPYPDKYDMLMDIATEEFSHLEIVGPTVQMLRAPSPAEMKDASNSKDLEKGFESSGLAKLVTGGKAGKEGFIHEAMSNPLFLTEAPGPQVTNSVGVPWSGYYVNANADLTVDLRSNIAAESRAKIVYEYLMQFTDDPLVKESLSFLMTREITHMQVFTAALETVLLPQRKPAVEEAETALREAEERLAAAEAEHGGADETTLRRRVIPQRQLLAWACDYLAAAREERAPPAEMDVQALRIGYASITRPVTGSPFS